jgi:hypothetical protein
VSGGGSSAAVIGGSNNTASGGSSAVIGGDSCTASGGGSAAVGSSSGSLPGSNCGALASRNFFGTGDNGGDVCAVVAVNGNIDGFEGCTNCLWAGGMDHTMNDCQNCVIVGGTEAYFNNPTVLDTVVAGGNSVQVGSENQTLICHNFRLGTDSSLFANGHFRTHARVVGSGYTATTDDHVVIVISGGAFTLPASAPDLNGFELYIHAASSVALGTVTVSAAGGDTLDSAVALSVNESAHLILAGSTWFNLRQ